MIGLKKSILNRKMWIKLSWRIDPRHNVRETIARQLSSNAKSLITKNAKNVCNEKFNLVL